ncbi:MAG: DHH family phosphoesterase [Patescibacteria group bacterium]|nr:DHH family phosphoesterase [Patescibacteria group bacterium]
MEIKNFKKAAKRILKAIRNREKIILYGDTDLDGVASVIILKETIKNLGGEITTIYFPDREIEGYGITKKGLNELKKFTSALLITLDLGIGNFKEVKLAKKMGFEVIIIDHHEILDGLPEAEIIIDPKQKGDKYPFKGLATAGIVFKFSETLLKEKMTENLRKNFLELTALATLADMMPKENENLEFINLGLKSLKNSWRPGIRAFFEMKTFKSCAFDNEDIEWMASKIISLLNVRDVEHSLPASFRLLSSFSLEESEKIIEKLIEKSKTRREKIKAMVAEMEKRLQPTHHPLTHSPSLLKKESPIIFEGDSDWEFTLISSVASIICHKYQKPTFIFKILEKESSGTVRTPKGVDSVALMKKCKRYLITYGGHSSASGFRIKNENLEKFKKCLIKNL